jgi:hypothetical protein
VEFHLRDATVGLFTPQGEAPIIKALAQQDNVGNCMVRSEYDHSREYALQYSTRNIEYIAHEPEDEKGQREPICRSTTKVLDNLWREYRNKASDGYGAGEQKKKKKLANSSISISACNFNSDIRCENIIT